MCTQVPVLCPEIRSQCLCFHYDENRQEGMSSKSKGIIALWENWGDAGLMTSNIWIHAPPAVSASSLKPWSWNPVTILSPLAHFIMHADTHTHTHTHKLISPYCFLLYIPSVFPSVFSVYLSLSPPSNCKQFFHSNVLSLSLETFVFYCCCFLH